MATYHLGHRAFRGRETIDVDADAYDAELVLLAEWIDDAGESVDSSTVRAQLLTTWSRVTGQVEMNVHLAIVGLLEDPESILQDQHRAFLVHHSWEAIPARIRRGNKPVRGADFGRTRDTGPRNR